MVISGDYLGTIMQLPGNLGGDWVPVGARYGISRVRLKADGLLAEVRKGLVSALRAMEVGRQPSQRRRDRLP